MSENVIELCVSARAREGEANKAVRETISAVNDPDHAIACEVKFADGLLGTKCTKIFCGSNPRTQVER